MFLFHQKIFHFCNIHRYSGLSRELKSALLLNLPYHSFLSLWKSTLCSRQITDSGPSLPSSANHLIHPWRQVSWTLLHLCMEKAMAPHSSTLAWKIPQMEEPGRLQSAGSLRVRHDWATSLSLFTFLHWRRQWQPTPVFLPGESQRWQSLVDCRLWGHTESDTTEAT